MHMVVTEATSATDSMQVCFYILRKIEVDDEVDTVNIYSPCDLEIEIYA